MVQQHAASHLHFDFRLEVDGVLRSWAVPKGPSLDPADKRFAAEVEDHPLDYAGFEGRIPDGNYGAGWVIVWDRGTYEPLNDFATGQTKGKLLFNLHGHKLHGRFTLVRMKDRDARPDAEGKAWLLIKEHDEWATTDAELAHDSVLSGLTVTQLADAQRIERAFLNRVRRLKPRPPEHANDTATTPKPMLAKPGEPFRRTGWVFEIKYDGYRLMIQRDAKGVRLISRNGNDLTSLFPEIADSAAKLPYMQFLIDGEVTVADARGVPSFSHLQQRARLRDATQIARAVQRMPVTFYAFDLLQVGPFDLREQPLIKRKSLLQDMLPSAGTLRFSEHVATDGIKVFEHVAGLGLEGVVGKRADSAYRAGRSDSWIKVRAQRTGDFVIVGWKSAKSNAADIGAIAVAEYHGERLTYVGNVGSGFGAAMRTELRARIDSIPAGPALIDAPGATIHWLAPRLVCEVEYKEFTHDGHLRHPVLLRLRDDKAPSECIGHGHIDDPGAAEVAAAKAPDVPVTNATKVFYPDKGLTKGDLVGYYEGIAEWMLPYLADRPLVLTRFPDGIDGKSFYQRDAPDFVPDWIERKTLWSDSTEREVNYFVVQNTAALKYLANLGTIPIHMWHSRVTDLEHPDWCVLDLDPKGAPFAHVVRIAKAIEQLLSEIALPGYLKTSGASGLHILIPLGTRLTHDQSKSLGELMARVIVAREGDIATIARAVRAREDKVYVDYLQNGHGQLLVAPFSARAEPAASVSMPLAWRELSNRVRNPKYHIQNARARMRRSGDPMRAVLSEQPDLEAALGLLAAIVDAEL